MSTIKSNAAPLAKALSAVLPVIKRWATIPVLSHVRFAVVDGELTVSGTNLDNQVDAKLAVEGDGFSACINPRPLAALLRSLGNAVVTLERGVDYVLATWDGGKATFPTLPASDFPDLMVSGEPVTIELPPTFISESIDPVRDYISREETRYYLNGVCLDNYSGGPVVVATDGYRLAAHPATAIADITAGRRIVPAGFVDLWRAAARGKPCSLILYGSTAVEVRIDGLRIAGKLIDGTFPNWQRLVTDTNRTPVMAARGEVVTACRRLAAMSVEARQQVRVVCKSGQMTLNTKSMTCGAIEQAIECQGSYAEPLGLNNAYLIQALKGARGDFVSLNIEDEKTAIIVRGSNDPAGRLVLLMPMRESFGEFRLPDAPAKKAA